MHRIFFAAFLYALLFVPAATAQCNKPLLGPGARGVEGRKSDVPVGFATEDWQWRYATGRALLGTAVPFAVANVGHRIGREGIPALRTASLALLGTGVAVGPSLGQWGLGGRCTRQSIVPTILRVGGVAGVAWAADRALEGEGFETPVLFLYTIPGMVVGIVGIIWSIGATPRIAVDEEERDAQSGPFDSISVHLRPAASLRQAGVQLRVQW
jgi:hypothetical protein